MSANSFPLNTLEQATSVLAACRQVDSNIMAGTMTQPELTDAVVQTQAIQTQINDLELQLIRLRTGRDERLADIWQSTKRLRNTVKGIRGDDSPEYKMVGGTRMSDRKRGAHKPAEPAVAKSKTKSPEVKPES